MMIEIALERTDACGGNVVNFYEYAARMRRTRPYRYSFEESLIMLGGYNIVSLSEHRNK